MRGLVVVGVCMLAGCGGETTAGPGVDAASDAASDAAVETTSDAVADVPPTPCNPTAKDCGPSGYCDAKDCKAVGVCRARPTGGFDLFDQACGCDGITYWNHDHAASFGQTSVSGACGGPTMGAPGKPVVCDAATPCADGTRCLYRSCDGTDGVCWRFPTAPKCAPDTFRAWATCDGTAKCLSLCDAVLTTKPIMADLPCE